MLSALPGADSQLQAHMGISMNVGLTAGQLSQLTQVLADGGCGTGKTGSGGACAPTCNPSCREVATHFLMWPRALPSRHDSVDAALSLSERATRAIGTAIMSLSMVSPIRTPASKRSATMSRNP